MIYIFLFSQKKPPRVPNPQKHSKALIRAAILAVALQTDSQRQDLSGSQPQAMEVALFIRALQALYVFFGGDISIDPVVS